MPERNLEDLCRRGLAIAIDGPAGAGKSTVGAGLAAALNSAYLDTGLMYRAVTWLALQSGVSITDEAALGSIASIAQFALTPGSYATLEVDGRTLGQELRSAEVDAHVSRVSAHAAVRSALVMRQRQLTRDGCVVVVGRDIGTVVLPDAPVKLWITASPEQRARRRRADREDGASLEEVAAEIRRRDELDSTRAISPLRRAADAITIETDLLDPEQAVQCGLDAVCAAADRMRASG